LTDEFTLSRTVEHRGDVPKDRASRLGFPEPVTVLVKCGGEVLRRAGHWVQDITETLRDEGRLIGTFRVWINQDEGRKFDALRKGMFLTYTVGEQEMPDSSWEDQQQAVRVEEEDQAWTEKPEVVLDYVLSLIAFRTAKEIIVVRNRHIWQIDEEIEAGDLIRITTAGAGGMFPGGLVGWQEEAIPMEWIIIVEAQIRLGQRNQARQDRIIYILRNGRHWDGGPPQMLDIFRIIVQGCGGAPKKSMKIPPPRPPPANEHRSKRRILIERCGYSQVFTVDASRPIQSITTQIAEEAKIQNPTVWMLSSLIDEIIHDSREIIEGQTYRLKSTVRIEYEGRTKCFNIGDEEDGMTLHHRVHRGLGTDPEHWDILDTQGTRLELGSKFRAGALYFLIERQRSSTKTEDHKTVRIVHRWAQVSIPIQDTDTMTSILILIETIMKIRERWELRNELDQKMEFVTQFRHQGI
jgi:hypothetical protein